jgi:hypothetical protein
MIHAYVRKGEMLNLKNKIRVTFLIAHPTNASHLQVGKRESLDRLRGDFQRGDALPVRERDS